MSCRQLLNYCGINSTITAQLNGPSSHIFAKTRDQNVANLLKLRKLSDSRSCKEQTGDSFKNLIRTISVVFEEVHTVDQESEVAMDEEEDVEGVLVFYHLVDSVVSVLVVAELKKLGDVRGGLRASNLTLVLEDREPRES